MLAISDDESGKSGSPKLDGSKKSPDGDAADGVVKHNFVYIVSIIEIIFNLLFDRILAK